MGIASLMSASSRAESGGSVGGASPRKQHKTNQTILHTRAFGGPSHQDLKTSLENAKMQWADFCG